MALPAIARSWIYTYILLIRAVLRQPKSFLRSHTVPEVPRVSYLPGGVVAKSTTRREYEALVMLNSLDPSLPVPHLLDCILLPEHTRRYFNCGPTGLEEDNVILLMTRLPGTPLGSRLAKFSEAQVTRLTKQLASVFDRLKQLQPPNGSICGLDGRPCVSYLMSLEAFGPFDSLAAFNAWMMECAQSRINITERALPDRLDNAKTRFVHGDLNPRNILADDDGNLTGVIDWECAGYMPEHWDPAYALCVYNRYLNWIKVIQGVFPDVTEAMEIEEKWRCSWGL
ncbi:aminoglycoside phosphotransferase [Calocera cornea HHB12733]|uniref:Aminoglycoside phosphotransferase n=1 Tax=Calocera cornea HHB12733 TaxID=1353952 RepID=A0A165E2Z8_9BASI|nr:aminoglycoside phosphotransferase [Calocera cornea HHB12733]